MNNGVEELEVIIKKIRYKGIIWIPQPEPELETPVHNVKKNYLVTWLAKNKNVGDIFTLDEFYKKYPKHKTEAGYKKRIEKTISNMIKECAIDQLHKQNGEDRFKVLKP